MSELNQPSGKLRERILAEVSFEQRFIAYRLHIRLGLIETALYSFEEVVGFLLNPIPQLDFKELGSWLRVAIGDEELAEEVNKLSAIDISDLDKTMQVLNLMAVRLGQCLEDSEGELT